MGHADRGAKKNGRCRRGGSTFHFRAAFRSFGRLPPRGHRLGFSDAAGAFTVIGQHLAFLAFFLVAFLATVLVALFFLRLAISVTSFLIEKF